MKVFGSISRLVSILFRANSQDITLEPNQSTTYTASRTFQLPNGDASDELAGIASTQTLTNKSISGSANTLSNISLTASVTGILPVANGGTNSSSVVVAPTATHYAGWDANSNFSANSLLEGYATTATAAGTTTLLVGSAEQQYFTGSTTQTVLLPVASTLVLGQKFLVVNNSSGVVTVQSSGANTVKAMAANTSAWFTAILTSGTTAASWNFEYAAQNATGTVTSVDVSGGTTGLTTSGGPVTGSGTITLAGTLAIANGGTGQTTANAAFNALSPMTTAGDLIYENATPVAARLAIGSTGQVLTVSGGLPVWSTPSVSTFNADWVTGDGTSKAVTHNLGTLDVIVQIYDKTDGATIEVDSVLRDTTNSLALTASEAPGAAGWRIMIIKA